MRFPARSDEFWRGVAPVMPGSLVCKRRMSTLDDDHRIDEAGEQSFPASDPPSWTLGTLAPDAVEEDIPRAQERTLQVKDLMTTRVSSIDWNDTASTAGRLMWDGDCGVLPVVDGSQRVVGVVTDRDICMAAVLSDRAPSGIVVSEVMSKSLHSCSPEDSLTTAEGIMSANQVRRLPIVDSDQRLIGILSLADLIRATTNTDQVLTTLADISRRRASPATDPPESPSN
jgi:CBS domain-containing protein